MEAHDSRCERLESPDGACSCRQRQRNHEDFIRLWTAAGSAANYDKQAWKSVERQLFSAKAI